MCVGVRNVYQEGHLIRILGISLIEVLGGVYDFRRLRVQSIFHHIVNIYWMRVGIYPYEMQ